MSTTACPSPGIGSATSASSKLPLPRMTPALMAPCPSTDSRPEPVLVGRGSTIMERMTAAPAPPPAALDAHGNPLGGPPELVARYDAAVDRLLRYHSGLLDDFGVLAAETAFPMGQVLAGYLSLTSTDTQDLAGAAAAARALDDLVLNEREAMHRAALLSWVEGDWRGAGRGLDLLLMRWPADLVALLIGHQLDFFLGDAANLRDRVARSGAALPTE